MWAFWLPLTVGTLLLVVGSIVSAFFAGSLFDRSSPATRPQALIGLCLGILFATGGGLLSTYAWSRQASEDARGLLTGGDSFVWLYMAQTTTNADQLSAQLVLDGDGETAYDIDVQFEKGTCDGFEEWTLFKAVNAGSSGPRTHFVPVLAPNVFRGLQVRLQPTCDDAYYLAVVQTRNRVAVQQTVLKRREGRWTFSGRVVDVATGEELLQKIDATVAADLQWPDIAPFVDRLRRAQIIVDELSR